MCTQITKAARCVVSTWQPELAGTYWLLSWSKGRYLLREPGKFLARRITPGPISTTTSTRTSCRSWIHTASYAGLAAQSATCRWQRGISTSAVTLRENPIPNSRRPTSDCESKYE